MNTVAVDTSVLLAIFKGEPKGELWMHCLQSASEAASLLISSMVYAEIRSFFSSDKTCRNALADLNLRHSPLNEEPANLAGRIFQDYRKEGGPRTTVLPDFLIAAHASIQANSLATEDRAREVLQRFKLEDHARHKPAELSGGQRQRVAIARAIAIRPKLLLFDEPTSALDPEMTAEVLDVIRELRDEGMDFVLVTHKMGFARAVADEVVFLADGQVIEHGPASQIFDAPKSKEVRDFLSRILRYEH